MLPQKEYGIDDKDKDKEVMKMLCLPIILLPRNMHTKGCKINNIVMQRGSC